MWHDIVYGTEGIDLGNSLLTQDLIDNHGFQFYLDDKEKWCPMLESLFQDEVYIMGTIVKELAMNVNLPGKMKFFILQALGSTKTDVIADKWIECSSKDIVQPAIDFITTDNHMEYIGAWLEDDPYYYDVRNACDKDDPDYGRDYIVHHWGQDVVRWLGDSSIGPKQYGLSVDTSVIESVDTEYPGGCFLAGTVVKGKEGNDIHIEDLQENDLILGRAGDVGVISSEKAGLTLKTATPVFGFNDDEPFFLSCHPFWSQDGWRAINPMTARDENDWLDVGQLKVGDYVCKVKSVNCCDVEYEWIKVTKFNVKVYPAGTRFYGIHTREGPRSYHANNYLVMQNYPEITIQRVADRMAKLNKKTQQAVQKELKRIKPTLKNVLGDAVAESVASLASKRVLNQLTKSSKKTKNAVQSKDFMFPTLQMKYEGKNVPCDSCKLPTSIMMRRRQLFIDKKFVKEMFISNEKEISWCRRVESGLWEHGHLKLLRSSLYGRGFIAFTKNKNDVQPVFYDIVTAHYKVNIYNCDKSKEEIDPPDKNKKIKSPRSSLTWYPCGSFEMGLKFDPDSEIWAAVDIGNMGGRSSVGGNIKLDDNDDDLLTVTVNFPPKYATYSEHIKLFGTFDAFYTTFQGYCIEYDPDAADYCGKTYGWRGTFDKYEEYDDDELELARKELLKSNMHSKANIGLSTPYVKGNLELSQAQLPSKMVMILKSRVSTTLSLDDLYLLTPPDPTELHNTTFSLLEKCMKYEMADEDRQAVLGEAKPILSGPEEAVAEAHKDFIGTRFAHCYCMNALSTQDSFKSRFSDTRRNQLLYYFAGDDPDGCMSTDQDYRASNNDLARLAFIALCPHIQDYIDDDGPGWAQKLYDYLTTPDKLLEFAMISEVDQDNAKIQKQAMVLYCLDPDKDLGCDFYTKVMMTKLQMNSDYFNGSDDVVDDMMDIIGDIIGILVDKILAGDDDELMGNIVDQCQKEMKELQDELDQYGEDMTTCMVDFVTQVVKRGGFKGDFWNRYFAAGKGVLDDMKPKIVGSALKWMCGMVLPAIGFFFTIQAFTNFGKLTPTEKASVILNASTASLRMINQGGPKLLDKFKSCFTKGKGDLDFVIEYQTAEETCVTLGELAEMTQTAGSAVAGEFCLRFQGVIAGVYPSSVSALYALGNKQICKTFSNLSLNQLNME